MQKNYTIYQDELPITEDRVIKYEQKNDINLPKDYRDFLLKYNGGVITPNYPKSDTLKTDIAWIERFYSLQDIELGILYNQRNIREYINEDIKYYEYNIEPHKLLFIGVCEIGNIHLYCGENGYGEIYYSNYGGGLGLEKTGLTSFTELLDSLSIMSQYWESDTKSPYLNWQSDKIFTFKPYFYHETRFLPILDDIDEDIFLNRFEEVLSYYGHPNAIHKFRRTDVVAFYLNYPIILKYLINHSRATYPHRLEGIHNLESLKFLVSKGASVEGLLTSMKNKEIIKFLIEECGQSFDV